MTQAVTKHAGGRPTKFKPEYCQQLIDLMAQGYSKEACAGEFGICEDTIYRWFDTIPEFSEAEKIARSKSRKTWEEIGLNGTKGAMPGFNSGSWIFNMKNRFGWRDKHEVEHSGSMTATINISLSTSEKVAPAMIEGDYEIIEAPDDADG